MKVKIVCAITMLAAVPAAAETKSPPIRQALVHEYARKQLPLARAAPWILGRSATGSREADLSVFAKLFEDRLKWRLEAETFSRR
jgi:hypothetical protein